MDVFSNIKTFANNYKNDESPPSDLVELTYFTKTNKLDRNIIYKISNKIVKDNSNNTYAFNYNGKKYLFSLLSSYDLQDIDKKILNSPIVKKVQIDNIQRILKLACSMDLVNPRVAIGNSILGIYDLLIVFNENNTEKVIDYNRNIVMDKNDYYEIFKYNELNIVDKYDLYNINYITSSLDDFDHIFYYLLFTKEILKDLSKNEDLEFLQEKYDYLGVNRRNYILFGEDCDWLFFKNIDWSNVKYKYIRDEVKLFTLNPNRKTRHIKYDKKKNVYILKNKDFDSFEFSLLSDIITDEKVKQILLSKDRYGKCHSNSNSLARYIINQPSYIVGGKIKCNECDYFLHSWVEMDDAVLDFNNNLVMNRDKYYKLYGALSLSKTKVSDMEDVNETIIFDAGLNFCPMDLNYFGMEIMRDLKKNEKVLKKR